MPLITVYTCGTCGAVQHVPQGSPVPMHCAQRMQWRQTREYKPELHGWETGMKSAAVGFRHTNPWMMPIGTAGDVPVESLRQLRHLENESAKMAADGIGQEFRARAFNQNVVGGGMQTNSFGEPPQRAPRLHDAQGRQKISITAVDGEPVDAMGPGADEALASALPEAPGV